MDFFRESMEHLEHAHQESSVAIQGLVVANKGLVAANQALVESSEAMQRAGDLIGLAISGTLKAQKEQKDMRETIGELQASVLDMVKGMNDLKRETRELKQEISNLNGGSEK